MAIADVVTMGYGSFSSVNKIPTLGYGSADAEIPDQDSLDWTFTDSKPEWTFPERRLEWTFDE